MTTLQAQYNALGSDQQQYFQHLAGQADESSVLDFFAKVPSELRDNPEHVELYLDGGTVTKEVWMYDRGRAGGHYETVEFDMRDRDWSHDVSKSNGGSNEASNGRFEEASDNRSRGADNTTPSEKAEASAEDEEDVRTLIDDVEDIAEATVLAEAAEVAGGLIDFSLDILAPAVGGAMAAKAVADRCETTKDKIGWGSLAGGGTTLVLLTPPGQFALGGYLIYRLGKRAQSFWQRRQQKASR